MIVGRIDYKEKAIFSLILDLEKKIVILNTLEIDLDKEGLEFNKRETTTFKIEDWYERFSKLCWFNWY